MKGKLAVAFVLAFVLVFFFAVLPAFGLAADTVPALAPLAEVTPEQLAEILLGAVGVALSLAFKYIPSWREWFEGFEHQGLLMLGFVVLTGGAYFALACSPYAAMLGIQITCELASAFVLLKAIFIVAMANQLTYLFAPPAKYYELRGRGVS